MTVQPLLTPDNYAENVLKLIESARTSLYFQNQYIKVSKENADEFVALLDALKNKMEEIKNVKIILRDIADTRPMLEALQAYGFEMTRVRLQKACHNKGIIVDSKIVCLGSHNWSGDGTVYNRDASLIFYNADIAKYYEEIFLYDWNNLARQKTISETMMPLVDTDELAEVGRGRALRLPWLAYYED
jgi:phosphatidylserine/phosphatidylglycerophosphate/cardiolipin synthase-like enzyme